MYNSQEKQDKQESVQEYGDFDDQVCFWDKPINFLTIKHFIQKTALKELQICNSQMDDDRFQLLLQAEWPVLKVLDLWRNKITKKGMRKFMNHSWPCLQVLRLSTNPIGNQVIPMLTKTHMPNIQNISIFQMKMSNLDIAMLTLGNYPKLNFFQIQNDRSDSIAENNLDGMIALHLLAGCFGNQRIFTNQWVKNSIIDQNQLFIKIENLQLSLPFIL